MNHPALQRLPATNPHSRTRRALTVGFVLTLSALGACSSVSTATQERITQSEVAVQQTGDTIGKSEAGAVELQRAREYLDAAKQALAKKQDKEAQRWADRAQLHAELAVVKMQSASARQSANEVLASVETLRQEAERNTPTPR